MEFKKIHWIGFGIGLLLLVLSFFLFSSDSFLFILGLAVLFFIAPIVISTIQENARSKEKEAMFLEFARNLVESVKSGTPISKSIVNLRKKTYGPLSVHVEKLANQIILGIPLGQALQIFAEDINNPTISRAIALIGEAERAGGDIGEILEAVADAVTMSDKIKKERQAVISTLTVQGYIIFVVFMVIILVLQFQILPMLSNITSFGAGGSTGLGAQVATSSDDTIAIGRSFFYLLLIQGLFSGLTIGQLSEGNLRAGFKHSFALMLLAFLVSSGAAFFGGSS